VHVIIALAALLMLRRPCGRGWYPGRSSHGVRGGRGFSSVDEISSAGGTAVQDRVFADVRANRGSLPQGRDQYEHAASALREAQGQRLVAAFAGFQKLPIHNFF
jgi:hypothetical protein